MTKNVKGTSSEKRLYRLQDALIDFAQEKPIVGKTLHTLGMYMTMQKKLAAYFPDNPSVDSITRDNWLGFFEWLRRDSDFLSESNSNTWIPNDVHTIAFRFYAWMVQNQMGESNLIWAIDVTKAADNMAHHLSLEKISMLLDACDENAEQGSNVHRESHATAKRDRAIVLLLWESGIRATELCSARFGDLDLAKRELLLQSRGLGRDRLVPFGEMTAAALSAYLRDRMPLDNNDFIFVMETPNGSQPLTRIVLHKLLVCLGEKCGVENVHPHRFRIAFAIEYIRNGGEIDRLLAILGRSM